MKRISNFALLLLLVAHGVSSAQDAAPKLINYQGRLTDAGGAPLGGSPGGAYSLKFEVFDVPTGGTAAWGETRQVTVVDGVFNVVLGGAGGTNTFGDLGAAFTNKDRYLQTTVMPGPGVATQQVLLPRQQLASVPFALVAQNANNATRLAGQEPAFYMPAGSVIAYGGTNEPTGWLLCDGRPVSRSTYAQLFVAIGTAHGSGDGTNTFHLPDYRGRFLRGVDDSPNVGSSGRDPDIQSRTSMNAGGNTTNAIGSVQGQATRKNGLGISDPGHAHSIPKFNGQYSGNRIPGEYGGNNKQVEDWFQNYAWPNTTGVTITTGDNETRPINAYVNYIIKY